MTQSIRPSAAPAPLRDDRRQRHRKLFLWISGVVAVAILVVASEVLLPFVLGILVAYILLPAVLRLERRKIPRWAAILIVYFLTLGTIAGFIAIIVPSLISEGRALRRELPNRIDEAQEKWLPVIDSKLRAWSGKTDAPPERKEEHEVDKDDADEAAAPEPSGIVVKQRPEGGYEVAIGPDVQLRKVGEDTWRFERVEVDELEAKPVSKKAIDRAMKYVAENSGELLKLGQAIVTAISRGIFNLFMTLMLGGYIMLTHEKIIRFFRELVALEAQPAFDRLLRRLDRGLSGVVRGQLFICLVNGVLSAIGFWLFDLKYWPLMALVAAVGSLIPIFGSILSAVPAVAIGLTQSPGTAFAVLAWIVGIHQLEANFLNPKIIGDAAKIHPVLVVFSLIVGEHFFQIKGALFAVPCMSILQTVFLHFRETTMGLADPLATGHPEASPTPPPARPSTPTPAAGTPSAPPTASAP
jgi:predicted PurR-regulated permease PerM